MGACFRGEEVTVIGRVSSLLSSRLHGHNACCCLQPRAPQALRGAAEARPPPTAAQGVAPKEQEGSKKWDATAAEIQRLRQALNHTAVDLASAMDPDLQLAIRLQQQELHLDIKHSKKQPLGSNQKRSLVGPLDNFFTRHKKPRRG